MKKLLRNFFKQPTLEVAKGLLGKYLIRNYHGKKLVGIITETEAYIGEDDLACHASRGRTKRTEVMYGEAGYAYIYLVYGMYYMFNIVTEKKNFPAAVLIRGIKTNNLELIDGPGKLTKYLKINKSLNGEDLIKSKKIWLEDDGLKIKPTEIKKAKRVGVDYARYCKHYLWRFILLNQ